MSSTAGVSLRLTHSIDENGEFDAFTKVNADIFMDQKKIGSINATIIDRQRIPPGYFMSAMDGHSQVLQEVGCTAYEPRQGRTKLRSLAQYDDTMFGTMYIGYSHIDDAYKQNGASDVGAAALRKFLHHPYIKGSVPNGPWKVSSAVYILDPLEAMSREERTEFERKKREESRLRWEMPEETDETRQSKADERRRLDELARLDANQFLRNGFFQDPAIARQGEDKYLVASYGHWSRATLSHTEAAAINFYVPPPKPPAPSGKDADILQTVIKACTKFRHQPPTSDQLGELRAEVSRLVSAGGSLFRSHAIHAASANNVNQVVRFCLEQDPSVVNSLDQYCTTPLMAAAARAAGRSTINGIDETIVIDTLLSAGADKNLQDTLGLTAYGHFKRQMKQYDIMMSAMMGQSSSTARALHPTELGIEQKLLPVGGPTASDLSGGEGAESGFMDYGDQEYDDMIEGDEDYGDY